MYAQVASRAPACSAQGLVNVLWATVKLRVTPEALWMKVCVERMSMKVWEDGLDTKAKLGGMNWD